MNKLIFFLFGMLFLACNSENNNSLIKQNPLFVLGDTIRFETKMAVSPRKSGTFYNKKTKEELLFFSNVSTSRKIKIFDINTVLIEEIQLDSVLYQCNSIDGINILSLDTIILLSQNPNALYFINKQGLVFNTLNLDNLVQKNSADYFEFRNSIAGPFILNDSTIVLHADWVHNQHKDLSELSHLQYLQEYIKTYWTKSNLLLVNNFSKENPSFVFKYNIYTHIFKKADSLAFLGELPLYSFTDKSIISWSSHSNKLLILDSNTNVLSVNSIESQKSEIGDPYLRITKETVENFANDLGEHERTYPVISRVLFDTKHKIYYIKVLNKITLDWFNKNKYRPWSLLIYDENFNKLDEIPFEDKKYNGMMKLSKRGLMIQTKTEITDYKNQTVVFEIYNYEK